MYHTSDDILSPEQIDAFRSRQLPGTPINAIRPARPGQSSFSNVDDASRAQNMSNAVRNPFGETLPQHGDQPRYGWPQHQGSSDAPNVSVPTSDTSGDALLQMLRQNSGRQSVPGFPGPSDPAPVLGALQRQFEGLPSNLFGEADAHDAGFKQLSYDGRMQETAYSQMGESDQYSTTRNDSQHPAFVPRQYGHHQMRSVREPFAQQTYRPVRHMDAPTEQSSSTYTFPPNGNPSTDQHLQQHYTTANQPWPDKFNLMSPAAHAPGSNITNMNNHAPHSIATHTARHGDNTDVDTSTTYENIPQHNAHMPPPFSTQCASSPAPMHASNDRLANGMQQTWQSNMQPPQHWSASTAQALHTMQNPPHLSGPTGQWPLHAQGSSSAQWPAPPRHMAPGNHIPNAGSHVGQQQSHAVGYAHEGHGAAPNVPGMWYGQTPNSELRGPPQQVSAPAPPPALHAMPTVLQQLFSTATAAAAAAGTICFCLPCECKTM